MDPCNGPSMEWSVESPDGQGSVPNSTSSTSALVAYVLAALPVTTRAAR